jgi:hypothetical protein
MPNETPAYKNSAFNMLGTVSQVESRTDKNGSPYIVAKFTTILKGKQQTRTLMVSGKALLERNLANGTTVEALGPKLVEGGEVRVYGFFERAPATEGRIGGEFICAIGLGLPPKAKAA